MYPIIY